MRSSEGVHFSRREQHASSVAGSAVCRSEHTVIINYSVSHLHCLGSGPHHFSSRPLQSQLPGSLPRLRSHPSF